MLNKWIMASIAHHFNTRINIPFFVQGQMRQEKSNYVVLYTSTVDMKQCVKDFSLIKVVVILLVSNTISDTNLYQHTENVGEVQKAFSDIPVLDDSSNQVGCLQLRDGTEAMANQKHPDANVLQTVVQGRYQFFYQGELRC